MLLPNGCNVDPRSCENSCPPCCVDPFCSQEGNPLTYRSLNLQAVMLWTAVLSTRQCLSFWCHVHSPLDTTGQEKTCTSEQSMLSLSMAMSIWGTLAVWLSHPSLTGKDIVFLMYVNRIHLYSKGLLEKSAQEHPGIVATVFLVISAQTDCFHSPNS